jgi:hypothetical protein
MESWSFSLCIVYLGLALVGGGSQGCHEADSSEDATPASGLAFTEVTTEAGLGAFRHETGAFGQKWMPETLGAGGGFIDYDGDEWLDILLVAGATWQGRGAPVPALQLYRNNRDGTFTNVTQEAGLDRMAAYGFGIAAADYDNDGDEDLFLTTLAENRLFRNEGGVFTEVGQAAGLADHAAWSTAALFFDADRDGWLDLYVGNYVPWTPEKDKWCTSDGETKDYCTPHQYEGTPGRFYRNNGDGTFTDRTKEAGLNGSPGKTLGIASLDFNNDGWMDVVVANDTERDLLYRNKGDGTFEEIGVASGMAFDRNGRARAGMGIDAAVLDGSGQPTIAIGNFSEEMVGLYRYMGNGLFMDQAPASGIGMPSLLSLTFGLFFFDVDLDSDLDLLLANGHIVEHIERIQSSISYRQPAQLFLNQDDGTFEWATNIEGGVFEQKLVGRGAAYGDYDRDGDLDILITENGGPAHLWRNELNPKAQRAVHFLRVHLEGAPPNRDAFGARLIAVTGNRRQEWRVRTGGSYLSQSEKTATFGLGAATLVDTLRVYWPSGRVDVFEQVQADQELRLVEGQPKLEPQASALLAQPTAGLNR